MFAVLTEPEKVYVGQLCNPVITYNISNYDNDLKEFAIEETEYDFTLDSKNILNNFNQIQKIKLFGIGDCMKFVTPEIYDVNAIRKMIKQIN